MGPEPYIYTGSSCSIAVEPTPLNQEVVGLYPACRWTFLSLCSFSGSLNEMQLY